MAGEFAVWVIRCQRRLDRLSTVIVFVTLPLMNKITDAFTCTRCRGALATYMDMHMHTGHKLLRLCKRVAWRDLTPC